MASYEELYSTLTALEKGLKDSASAVARLQKAVVKNTEEGNLTELKKNLEIFSEQAKLLSERIEAVSEETSGFDTKEYFTSGDFTRELLESCSEKGVDVRGEMGIYEMFPYKVRIVGDTEHAEEVYINRKKIPSFRPSFVAETVRQGQEKLFKASFNSQAFMTELADAYEIACLKSGARDGSTQALDKVYKFLVPMARARKEYDKQAFAFDLARLYEAGAENWVTKSGERFYFGTSRDGKSGIRVLSSTGVEAYINTLKPVME